MKNYNRTSTSVRPNRRPMILFCLCVFLVSALLISGSYVWRWMANPNSFPITHIRVEGKLTHETHAQILQVMQTNLSGGFFSLHVSASRQAILALPWIADVSFRRIWPHTLAVRIVEQKAVARFGKTGVLNEKGDVFYPSANSLPQNLPDLEGPVDQAKALFSFYNTVNPLAQLIGLTVTKLHVNAEQDWRLQLSNQVQVALGHVDVMTRFKRFIAVYPKITALNKNAIVSIDLRYPNGVAVQYADTTPSTKPATNKND
jgi:cell division protein FtsQ